MKNDSIFFFKQKTAYEISLGLVGSEMCIRDRSESRQWPTREADIQKSEAFQIYLQGLRAGSDLREEQTPRSQYAFQFGWSYSAEQFRQIKRSLAEQFRQIKRSLAEPQYVVEARAKMSLALMSKILASGCTNWYYESLKNQL